MTPPPGSKPNAPVEVLRRWEDTGAVWRLLSRRGDLVEIALLTCSAGEEVGRLVSADPDLLAFVGTRTGNE
ncbi:MAG TPA: hypothetical protein VIM19_19205 [Actinomycetes bacterium]